MTPAHTFRPLTTFRADGWPLCPRCGEDELWSPYWWDGQGEKPSVQVWIDAGLTCYACQYRQEARKDMHA